MDKFGIFNLLNSFLSVYQNNKTACPDVNAHTPNASEAAAPVPRPAETAKSVPPRANVPPLQASMLNVLSSHDAFVRRVREKNKNQT